AEYWGADFVDSDMWVRTNGVPARAEQWLAAQPAHMRAYLDAFVAGLNAYAAQHADSLSAEYRRALPLRTVDLMAHHQRVVNFGFVANPGIVAAAQRALDAPGVPMPGSNDAPGSNAWAIGPDRSDSRNAMLLANPHLPWSDVFMWYEAHMVAPEVDAYGATL